jgi:hypothetical protein
MKEQLGELHERVQSARAALEALAERATELRARLQAARPLEDPPFATVPVRAAELEPRDPFMPVGPPLATALDRLTQGVRPIGAGGYDRGGGEGDDGRFVSDAWEIALINEEGK